MAGRVSGKVAFITGAARGQGRNHAVRLAEQGADIIAVDVCEQIATATYPLGTWEELLQTQRLVEKAGRRCVAAKADVRDLAALEDAARQGVDRFGRLDIVCANAAVSGSRGPSWTLDQESWNNTMDVNVTGVWHTVKATVPHMLDAGHGGSIIITSSAAGIIQYANISHYVASKHAVVGLMRTLALELAGKGIRVNTVHPGCTDTPMIQNPGTYKLFAPHLDNPDRDSVIPAFTSLNAIPIPWLDVDDITHAVLYLASDESRYVTGAAIPVDAGATIV